MSEPTDDVRWAETLTAALVEIEHYVGERGWDQPSRLFALVPTAELVAAEPSLAAELGVTGGGDRLTPIEQEHFDQSGDVLEALLGIVWPESVYGCALAIERTFLPAEVEDEIPADPEAASEFVNNHPQRQDVRVVVGVDRRGNNHGVARLVSQPDELLGGAELVPGLARALAHTLAAE